MSTISKEQFEELKQRTVNCVNEPNCESIESLRQFITKCDNNFINSLYQYSIFPLRLIIANLPKKQNNCEKTLISSVECLSLILQKSRINRFDIFADIFANLFHLIDDNYDAINEEQKFAFKATEDLILSVIKCSKTLIQSCDNCLLPQLVSPSFSAQFGHSIHILLNTAKNQKFISLKVEAIETIDCLINKCELSLTQDCLKSCPQDLIAYFLPGISINVSKLISCDDKLNRKVISSSLTLLSNAIVFVFKDLSTDPNIESEDSKQVPIECQDLENPQFFVVRDNKWLTNTCDKMSIIFEKIISNLISHQNSSVRQSLSLFVIKVLSNCSPLFTNQCLSVLIRVPLTYISEDFEQLRLESDSFLTEFSKSCVTCDSSKSYMDLIEDQIISHITRLPRIIRIGTEREKITSLYLLYGYLKCLDTNGINYLFYSLQHKQKLFECLIDICALNVHGIELLEQVSDSEKITYLEDQQLSYDWVTKKFSFINEEKSVTALTKCCQMIAIRVESQVLIDYLVDIFRQSKLNPSVLFIANHFISELTAEYKETEELLDLYLKNINSLIENNTIERMNKEILRQCLLIEGLTSFLHLYDSESAHNYLRICLFPLLESVGASNEPLFETSYKALSLVSQHFGYNCVSELIADNIDYLINSICLNLKHFIDNQRVPTVIKVMLKYSTEDMLHLFVDAIEQIILVIDCYYRTQALPLMQVLYSFVCTLNHYFSSNIKLIDVKVMDGSTRHNCFEKRAQSFVEQFEDFIRNRKVTQNLDIDSESISDNEVEDENHKIEDEKKKVPFFVVITEKILERCIHIMSNSDPKVRLIVLNIVIEGLRCLKPFEDNLLPMAHKLWSPLVERFADKDIIVMKRSFNCLQIMSKTCGDFIRQRTVKEVFPKILSFLSSQSEISYKKERASAYRFTIAYQFQIDILCGIGSVAVDLDLKDKELWQLIVGIMPYLSSYQPAPLQESALIALQTISESDSTSVFYYLKMIYSSDETLSQNQNKIFSKLRFGSNNKEFNKNVTKLLDYLPFN